VNLVTRLALWSSLLIGLAVLAAPRGLEWVFAEEGGSTSPGGITATDQRSEPASVHTGRVIQK
jgi:hypothetical protein